MAAKLLMYHMDETRMQAVEGVCAAIGVEPVRVDAGSHRAPVGLLSGTADMRKLSASAADMMKPGSTEAIDEEMIVMSDFTQEQFNALLEALKEMSIRIALKAVETPFNQYWTGEMLQAELKKEREAFRRQK